MWLRLLDINLDDHGQVERALLSMNEVLLCGLDELSPSDLRLVTEHCKNMENWAKQSSEKLKEKTGGHICLCVCQCMCIYIYVYV